MLLERSAPWSRAGYRLESAHPPRCGLGTVPRASRGRVYARGSGAEGNLDAGRAQPRRRPTLRARADARDPRSGARSVRGSTQARFGARSVPTRHPDHSNHAHEGLLWLHRVRRPASCLHVVFDKDCFNPTQDCGEAQEQGNCPCVKHWIVGGGDAGVVEKWILTDFANEVKGDAELMESWEVDIGWCSSIDSRSIPRVVSTAVTGPPSWRWARRRCSPLFTAGATSKRLSRWPWISPIRR